MSKSTCPICRGKKIENDQCLRCRADLSALQYVEGKLSALYSALFLYIRREHYTDAMVLIIKIKALRNDTFIKRLERYVQANM